MDEGQYDGKVDIWSLGITCIELGELLIFLVFFCSSLIKGLIVCLLKMPKKWVWVFYFSGLDLKIDQVLT